MRLDGKITLINAMVNEYQGKKYYKVNIMLEDGKVVVIATSEACAMKVSEITKKTPMCTVNAQFLVRFYNDGNKTNCTISLENVQNA